MTAPLTVSELGEIVGAEVVGDDTLPIRRVAPLSHAGGDAIGFCTSARYLADLRRTNAGAVLIRSEHLQACPVTALVVTDPYYAYAQIAERLHPPERPEQGIHASAVIAEDVVLGEGVSIGAKAVVAEGAYLGNGVIVGPGCQIGAGTIIGDQSRLVAQVYVGAQCTVGRRALIHPGVVIGADGFGFARGPGKTGWRKVPQLGGVRIGDDVEIGANATIDRGALEDTVIEYGVKLDNHVHVAHNVRIGERTIIAGNTVIAGSTVIGCDCMIGGASAITGHIEVTDGVTLLGMTGVTGHIRKPGAYSSSLPAQPVRQWRRNAVRATQLDNLFRRVRALEAALSGLATVHNSDTDEK